MFKTKLKQTKKDDYEIDKVQFDLMKDDAILIDVRDHSEFKLLKQIPDCQNIPYRELIADPFKYLPDQTVTIITICNAGHRSTAAAQFLREFGYQHAYVLVNGIYGYYR